MSISVHHPAKLETKFLIILAKLKFFWLNVTIFIAGFQKGPVCNLVPVPSAVERIFVKDILTKGMVFA